MNDVGGEGAEIVRHALSRTLEAQSARFEFRMHFRPMELGRYASPAGCSLLAGLGSAVGTVMRTAFRLLTRHSLSAEGVIDFPGRRLMMDFGCYAVLVAEGRRWSGRSGRPIATLPADVFPAGSHDPLWLLDMLQGVTEAQHGGNEMLGERRCRQFSARVDLSRAAELSPDHLALPPAKHYGDLLAVPLQVWIDEDTQISRILMESDITELTLALLEYGVELPADWSRLPTFRSADDASG